MNETDAARRGRADWEHAKRAATAVFHIRNEQAQGMMRWCEPFGYGYIDIGEASRSLALEAQCGYVGKDWDPRAFVLPFPNFMLVIDDAPWKSEPGETWQNRTGRIAVAQANEEGDCMGTVEFAMRQGTENKRVHLSFAIMRGSRMVIAQPIGSDVVDHKDEDGTKSAASTLQGLGCLLISTILLLNSTRAETVRVDDPLRPPNRQQRRAEDYVDRDHYEVAVRGRSGAEGAVRAAAQARDLRQRPAHWVRRHLRHLRTGAVIEVKWHSRCGVPTARPDYDLTELANQ